VSAFRSEKLFKNSTTDSMTTSINNNNSSAGWSTKNSGKRAVSTFDILQSKVDWLKQKVASKKANEINRSRAGSGQEHSRVDSIDLRYYGDEWSSDEEDVGDSDEHYPKAEEEDRLVSTRKYGMCAF
jgi:hypothetical protein